MLSLSKKCRNCKYSSLAKCKPVDLLVLDFLKIDAKIAYLEELKEQAKQTEEAAIAALQAACAKQSCLNKQKKFLKR